MTDDGYWTYREWVRHTVNKIANIAFGPLERVNSLTGHANSIGERDREGYLRVQIEAAIAQSLRHGRSGRGDDDPVTP